MSGAEYAGGSSALAVRLLERLRNVVPKQELERAIRAANNWFPGAIAARHLPVSPLTYEVRADLASASLQTQPIVFDFPRPIELVGASVSVIETAAGALTTPSADELLCDIEIDSREHPTVNKGDAPGNLVTLNNFTNPNRIFAIRLTSPSPRLAVTYQWRRGANTCNPANIALAFFARDSFA